MDRAAAGGGGAGRRGRPGLRSLAGAVLLAFLAGCPGKAPEPPPKAPPAPPAGKGELDRIRGRLANPAFRELLDSERRSFERAASAEAKGRAGPALALLSALERGDRGAVEKAGGATALKDGLAALLSDPDPSAWPYAATLLGVVGDPAYAPGVARALADPDRKDAAAFTLGLMGARACVGEIAGLLTDESEENVLARKAAVDALVLLDAREKEPEIAARLKDPAETVRRTAAVALLLFGSENRSREILETLRAGDPKDEKPFESLWKSVGIPIEDPARIGKAKASLETLRKKH